MAAEELPQPDPTPLPRVFLSPEVVEVHLRNGMPVKPEKAKLIWAIRAAFERDDFI